MGFANKIKNKLQDATSVGFEKIDESGYNYKISDKKSDIKKVEKDLGAAVYQAYLNGETFSGEVVELCEKIDGINEEIEAIEKQKEVNAEKAQAERNFRKDLSEDDTDGDTEE